VVGKWGVSLDLESSVVVGSFGLTSGGNLRPSPADRVKKRMLLQQSLHGREVSAGACVFHTQCQPMDGY
jgi:hypothetical protein